MHLNIEPISIANTTYCNNGNGYFSPLRCHRIINTWSILTNEVSKLLQGFQLSRIERESPAWTLFLPLSRQACKISHINEKNPAKHVKSPASVGETVENNYLANFHWQEGIQPHRITMTKHTYQFRLKRT